MTSSRRPPELLAPAGSPEALRAAVNNGADAVYLGVEAFNARRGAPNFTIGSLPDATRYAHLRGARVYLTANVVILPDEIDSALELVAGAWQAGVDAIIVQDLGLLSLVAREMPQVRLHASTQINAHNLASVEYLARTGVSRVTLARETSLGEIEALSSRSGVEIEAFVHGALCMSYSGQCLLSSLIGRRSANRGLCAQPCRMPYELLDERSNPMKTPGPYLLSPKDLCTIDSLGRMIGTGVAALKIEGRMKDAEYVALVTGVYRRALDRAAADPEGYGATDAEHDILAEAFSRGFSSAYLDEITDDSMMSYTRPNNRGVAVGRVAHVEGRRMRVSLDRALDTQDTIEIWTSRGRKAQRVGSIEYEGREVRTGPAGAVVGIEVEGAISPGDRVFRVANSTLIEAARRTFADAEPSDTPVDVSVRLVEGRPLRIGLSHGAATGVSEGASVEKARTKAITVDEVTEHVGRLGGTPFRPESWDIELQPGVGIGFSELHRVRREAAASLEDDLLSEWSGRPRIVPVVESPSRASGASSGTGHDRAVPDIVAVTPDLATARACLAAGARRVQMPLWAVRDLERGEWPEGLVVELPRIAHEREFGDVMAAVSDSARVVAGNLGLVGPSSEAGAFVEAHWSLNAVNPWACAALADEGAQLVWLSPELSGRQIASVTEASPVPVATAIYGRQEVMVTEHCVLMAMGECGRVCGTCPRRGSWYALRDRKGYSFPVMTDSMGRSHIYNSVPLDLTAAASELLAAGVAAVRLDFTVERIQAAQRITRIVREALRAAVGGREIEEAAASSATTGHFFRGVR